MLYLLSIINCFLFVRRAFECNDSVHAHGGALRGRARSWLGHVTVARPMTSVSAARTRRGVAREDPSVWKIKEYIYENVVIIIKTYIYK